MKIDGTTVYSKECVIFLNSVNNILNIIKQTGLKSNEVNIIVGNSADNDSQIKKLGVDFTNGRIPLKGEKHKMFTFCTSTAFAGCDFYSTNATSFVISDSKRVNTAIDIATDLVQIAGRQRLAENPFRKHIVFVYNMSMLDKSEEVFEKELQDKLRLTYAEVESNNLISDKALRQKRIRDVCRLQKMLKYDESFIMYDSLQDKFVLNEMAMLNERYSYDLQRYNYESGIIIKNELIENGFEVQTNQCYKEYEKQLEHIVRKESFADRMKSYCDYRGGAMFNLSGAFLEQKYPELRIFYDELGGERIKALGYKECSLKNEVALRNKSNVLRCEFVRLLSKQTLNADRIKKVMNEVYENFGVKKKGKVSDLSDLYGLKVVRHRPTSANGERGYLYEIE